jgi:uncharacterized protein YutE (UPF0331/DUF86 family)
MARYFVEQKYKLSLSQSREALDELKSRGDLTFAQHHELLKIIGFCNVLVNDYLDLNDGIVQSVMSKRHYAIIDECISAWKKALEQFE